MTKHGHYTNGRRSPTYISWMCMKSRCNNPKNEHYVEYGGRGIKVCERWNSFENFLADMGTRPPGKTLDRSNNDGDYTPDNCHWATTKKQNRNQRRRRSC